MRYFNLARVRARTGVIIIIASLAKSRFHVVSANLAGQNTVHVPAIS